MSYSEENFAWSDGTERSYTNWYSNQPDSHGTEHCTQLGYGSNGQWNDRECDTSFRYICKAPKGKVLIQIPIVKINASVLTE